MQRATGVRSKDFQKVKQEMLDYIIVQEDKSRMYDKESS